MAFVSECAPAFDYARSEHSVRVENGDGHSAHFDCPSHINLDLRYTVGYSGSATTDALPSVALSQHNAADRGFLGDTVMADFTLSEGQVVTFVLSQRALNTDDKADKDPSKNKSEPAHSVAARSIEKSQPPPMHRSVSTNSDSAQFHAFDPYGELGGYVCNEAHSTSATIKPLTFAYTERLLDSTTAFWLHWVSKMKYKGRWREIVLRSALTLKLLTFSPTGAIIAAPTFSLPEDLHGAGRNWWVNLGWKKITKLTHP